MPAEELKLFIFALASGVLPTLIWLFYWLEEDKEHPEPKNNIVRAFVAGGLAVFLAYFFEKLINPVFGPLKPLNFNLALTVSSFLYFFHNIGLIFSWAAIEECLKFVVAYIAVLRSRAFDEPIDGMVYMITVALGFAAVENTLFLLSTLAKYPDGSFILLTGNLRFLGATMLHVISSAVVGGAIALSFCTPKVKKAAYIFFGLLIASVLHALFNFFIMANNGKNTFEVLMLLWVGAIFVLYLFERVKAIVCRDEAVALFLKTKRQ